MGLCRGTGETEAQYETEAQSFLKISLCKPLGGLGSTRCKILMQDEYAYYIVQ